MVTDLVRGIRGHVSIPHLWCATGRTRILRMFRSRDLWLTSPARPDYVTPCWAFGVLTAEHVLTVVCSDHITSG